MLAFALLTLTASDVPYAGKLIVEPTTEGAEVFVDGLQCDATPCEMEVSAGVHEITVRKPGYETRITNARVVADHNNFLSVKLYPEPSSDEVRERIAKNVRIAAWAALGGAVAAGAGALIMNFAGFQPAYAAYRQQAANQPTEPGLEQLRADAALTQKAAELTRLNLATGGFIVAAGLAVASSLTLFLIGPRTGSSAASTEVKPVAWAPVIAPTQGGAQIGLTLGY